MFYNYSIKTKYFIGTSGWSYQHWKEKFYPNDLASNKWLSFYSEHFNTVELNMSFYRTPFPNMIKSWTKNTPNDFIFSIKASRFITHVKKLIDIDSSIKNLYQLAENFQNKCKCILFQLPPSLHLNQINLNRLENLFTLLNYTYDHSVEFRDNSWWDDKCYQLLNKKAAFCIVNGLGMPDDYIITNNFLYIRFHGQRYNTNYSEKELKEYSKKIKDISQLNSIERVYIYFNNDANCYAVKNALYLKKILNN